MLGFPLNQAIQEEQLEILPTSEPTDVSKTPDLLDFLIFKALSRKSLEKKTNLQTASDHTPKIPPSVHTL
jgi:hypothetical protein